MSSQAGNLVFTLRSTIFDRPRQLTLTPEYLEFDDNDLAHSAPTRFLKQEIESLRYGVKGIRGYSFYIGRNFSIDIRSTSGQVIKLRLKSLYRIRRKQLADKYAEIVNALFNYYFHDITRQYLKEHITRWFQKRTLVNIGLSKPWSIGMPVYYMV